MTPGAAAGGLDELLNRSRNDDHAAFDQLARLAYAELRSLAHMQRLRWSGDHTLETTAIVHEAYIKLAERSSDSHEVERSHLLAVAARAMRQVLVDYYRARRTQKRGGRLAILPLDQVDELLTPEHVLDPSQAEQILALDDALQRLAAESERHARIIDCRYFGGLTIEETARALGLSVATVKRGTAVAHAWLARDLNTIVSDDTIEA